MGQWATWLPHGILFFLCTIWISTHAAANMCPTVCTCQNSSQGANITMVTCSHSNLSTVPHDLPVGLEVLDLSGNSLTLLDSQLSRLITLVDLDLSANSIQNVDNNTLQGVGNLQSLDLSRNQLSWIEGKSFGSLISLEELNLSGNKLTFLDNETFYGLPSLKRLYLKDNAITYLESRTFQHLENIELIDLSGNEISNLESSMFVGAETLIKLELQNNAITHIGAKTFLSLQNLKYLDLSNNKLTNIYALNFDGMSSLTSLSLQNNDIGKMSAGFMGNSTQLQTLYLSENSLTNISIPLFAGLTELTYLALNRLPMLTNPAFNALHGLPSLQRLNMSQNPRITFMNPHIFERLEALTSIDLSENNLSALSELTFRTNLRLKSAVLKGNAFRCNCNLAWLAEKITNRSPVFSADLQCLSESNKAVVLQGGFARLKKMCGPIGEVNTTDYITLTIGDQAVLRCNFTHHPHAVVIWTTPRKQVLTYHAFHPHATYHLMREEDVLLNSSYHATHVWHTSSSYYASLVSDRDRVRLLTDGSLYIDYLLRGDNGAYTCHVRNAYDNSTSKVYLRFDYNVMFDIKVMSIVVGCGSAFAFFLLNLIVSSISLVTRRLVSKRRREAIHSLITNMDGYKTAQFTKLRENYNGQLVRIRDQYHTQLTWLSENYHSQLKKVRKGCSQQVDKVRENYTTQVGRLRNYSTHQVDQIRDMYNNQVLKIRDYSSLQMVRFHHKYKLKQQHIIKLIEMMNIDNCKSVIETECMRTESMIFDMDLLQDVQLTPLQSGSESEYVTASSSENSSRSSLNMPSEEQPHNRTSLVIHDNNSSIVSGDARASFVAGDDSTLLVIGDDSTSIQIGDDSTSIVIGDDITCYVVGNDITLNIDNMEKVPTVIQCEDSKDAQPVKETIV